MNVRSFNRSSFSFSSDLFRDRDLRSDLRSSLSSRSFIGIRQFKRLEFRFETAVPSNQLKQVFAPVKFDLVSTC